MDTKIPTIQALFHAQRLNLSSCEDILDKVYTLEKVLLGGVVSTLKTSSPETKSGPRGILTEMMEDSVEIKNNLEDINRSLSRLREYIRAVDEKDEVDRDPDLDSETRWSGKPR